jgi:PleD family two-component response regulator
VFRNTPSDAGVAFAVSKTSRFQIAITSEQTDGARHRGFTEASFPYHQSMAGRRRILIVEDDVDLRRMFRAWLKLAGFNVQEAADGLEALRMVETHPPDAVVLDLTG